MNFDARKRRVLEQIASSEKDKSKKGGLDIPIAELIASINAVDGLYTTSSCSGRTSIFAENVVATSGFKGKKKGGGGSWLYVTHDLANEDEVLLALTTFCGSKNADSTHSPPNAEESSSYSHQLPEEDEEAVSSIPPRGQLAKENLVVLRFEPFILTTECLTMGHALKLVNCALQAGFRESGITAAEKRIIVGIRCSIRLEVPVIMDGKLLVQESYIRYLAQLCNEKMHANQARINRFQFIFQSSFLGAGPGAPEAYPLGPNGTHPEGTGSPQLDACMPVTNATGAALSHPGEAQVAVAPDLALLVVKGPDAQACRVALRETGWLSPAYKPRTIERDGRLFVALPLLPCATAYLPAPATDMAPPPGSERHVRFLWDLCRQGTAQICREHIPEAPPKVVSPYQAMVHSVQALMEENGLAVDTLTALLPTKWERLGDLAIIPDGCLVDAHGFPEELKPQLWKVIASGLGVNRLARQARVAPNGMRESRVELLLGEDGWVEHLENGITYTLDVTKCMFSSGNGTEKQRVASMRCEGQTVVDLYAGIGYFSLPYLVRAGAAHLYACEWNPNALEALRRNLRANGVEDRATVLAGDNQETAPRGVADHVNLGMLPSSESRWATAIACLRPEGGTLHIHENVNENEEDSWRQYVVARIKELAGAQGRDWEVSLAHLERVKWYAPHIRHVVADVACGRAVARGAEAPRSQVESGTVRDGGKGKGAWLNGGAVQASKAPSKSQPSSSVSSAGNSVVNHAGNRDVVNNAGCRDGAAVSSASAQPLCNPRPSMQPHPQCAAERPQAHSLSDESSPHGLPPHHAPRLLASAASAATPCTQECCRESVGDVSTGGCRDADKCPLGGGAMGWLHSVPTVPTLEVKGSGGPGAGGGAHGGEDVMAWFRDHVVEPHRPVLLAGLGMGPALYKWTPEYLRSGTPDSAALVSAHVCAHKRMSFQHKNFTFATMSLAQLVDHCLGEADAVTGHGHVADGGSSSDGTEAQESTLMAQPGGNAPLCEGTCSNASDDEARVARGGTCPQAVAGMGNSSNPGGAAASSAPCDVGTCNEDACSSERSDRTVPSNAQRGGRLSSHAPRTYYYLRSLGCNPRKEPSDIQAAFPHLSQDLQLPRVVDPLSVFSSVLRISSAAGQLWTHFDTMDNILMQVVGRKRVVLWPPHAARHLYVHKSTSAVLDIDAPDIDKFPNFHHAMPHAVACTLEPGQMLFIPALWFHNVLPLDFSVSVNLFWRSLPLELYPRKDLYGNADLVPATQAEAAVDTALEHLSKLPQYYRCFYGQTLVGKLQEALGTEE
eukprot:jgi/Mesvir1/23520/Mv18225-RA.1